MTNDPGVPTWRGINHLALITDDMDRTVRFWHGVLGAELVATIGTPDFRHYFFRIGEANSIAFFEYSGFDVPSFAKPAGVPDPRAPQFDHLSLNLPDEDALLELRSRLKEHGIEVTDEVDHGFLRSIYFTDPTGIALEASYWVNDPTGAGTETAAPLFGDPDPVPAARELVDTGRVTWDGTTALI